MAIIHKSRVIHFAHSTLISLLLCMFPAHAEPITPTSQNVQQTVSPVTNTHETTIAPVPSSYLKSATQAGKSILKGSHTAARLGLILVNSLLGLSELTNFKDILLADSACFTCKKTTRTKKTLATIYALNNKHQTIKALWESLKIDYPNTITTLPETEDKPRSLAQAFSIAAKIVCTVDAATKLYKDQINPVLNLPFTGTRALIIRIFQGVSLIALLESLQRDFTSYKNNVAQEDQNIEPIDQLSTSNEQAVSN